MAKILIIEDDAWVGKLTSRAMLSSRHTVTNAENGLEGLSAAARELPDLIITDLMMPAMDGIETIKLMRQNELLKDIPVIVLTSVRDKETILSMLKLGVSYYYTKPVEFEILQKKVAQVLEYEISRKTKQHEQRPAEQRTPLRPVVVMCEPNENLGDKLAACLRTEYEVIKTDEGAYCLSILLRTHADVLLLESEIPLLSGIEVAARIRNTQEGKQTKILMFASPANEEEIKHYSAFFDGIIHKPYAVDSVLQ